MTFKPAEFPERKCRETIWSPMGIAYNCDVTDRHPGPCAAIGLADSVKRREAYEQDHPDWRDKIDTSDYLA